MESFAFPAKINSISTEILQKLYSKLYYFRRKVHYDLQASMPKGRNFLLVNLIDTHPRLLSKSITVH